MASQERGSTVFVILMTLDRLFCNFIHIVSSGTIVEHNILEMIGTLAWYEETRPCLIMMLQQTFST